MKIVVPDQMPRLRAAAEASINAYFNARAAEFAHRDHEYAAKRQAATQHINGVRSWHIEQEAAIRGVSPSELAELIGLQPDLALERGLERVRMIAAVRKAKTPDDIKAALSAIGGAGQL